MANAYDNILKYAQYEVDAGTRDADEALFNAYNDCMTKDWVKWEVLKDCYTPDEVIRYMLDQAERNPDEDMYERVCSEVYDELQRYIADHTWTITFVDTVVYDEEYASEDEFRDAIKELTTPDGGWKLTEELLDGDHHAELVYMEEDE